MFGMTNKRSAIKLSAAVFAAILVAGVGSAVAGTTPQATHLVPVLLPGLRLARSLGRAPGNQRLTIGVSIATPDPAGEQALYNALYDPSSPLYHRFISPAEYAARFGVAPDTVARVTSWLRAGGLRIETVTGSGTYVTASGTIAQLDRLFAITMLLATAANACPVCFGGPNSIGALLHRNRLLLPMRKVADEHYAHRTGRRETEGLLLGTLRLFSHNLLL